jgi:hypothetical protein
MRQAFLLAVLFFSGSSCGLFHHEASAPEPEPSLPPRIVAAPTPKPDRGNLCFINVEADPEKATLLAEYNGTWVHQGSTEGDDMQRQEFMLDLTRSMAAVTQYYSFYKNVDDMSFGKTCLSQPLDSSFQSYAGYRILELMSSTNEGGAAIFIKLDSSGVLTASDRYYSRYAATDDVLDLKTAVNLALSLKAIVYPTKQ